MRKPIFENEDQALEFCRQMDFEYPFTVIETIKEKGYIKKTDLEIARENYNQYRRYIIHCEFTQREEPAIYIEELEKEIDRLKKER